MNEQQRKIHRNPKLTELVRTRQRLAWGLTTAVLGSFFCYLMVGILRPDWLAAPVVGDSIIGLGWLLGAIIIVLSWLATGLYAWRANSHFDRLSREILEESV
ncbi:Uncharacterized membrane protein, DUF485 family [Lampropedia hyalina DSM 16112]|jgi:uncharacterized membrane protein (DUF485 family)|uniref:Uncharacterized membrane protein, DUF485 family n=1 Tax=Lampropedia hyalina DSM 16112 TaxID=1122156 RepID=A0A1M4U1X6_9BURK|nr:DUF485 domain-containing protein [Lampropedia hyalina]SHE50683.1 Uncharacterized membrane protein, DUF485 family [Lampropedia hyalina DSM 16112]